MKSALIFVLLVALGAGAYMTKPTEADFKQYITDQKTHGDNGVLKATWDQYQADRFVKSCVFNNRIFWLDVQQNGTTVYSGAFNHWFNRAQISADVSGVQQKIDSVKLTGK